MKIQFAISLMIGLSALPGVAKTGAPSSPHKVVYQLVEDGGEHPSEKCQLYTDDLPKLKTVKKFSAEKSYLGSKQIEFADKNEAGIDAFEHYYSAEAPCEKVRARLTKESEQ